MQVDEYMALRLKATFSTAPSTLWPLHRCWQAHQSNTLQGLHQVHIN